MHDKSLAFAFVALVSCCLSGCGDNPGSWPVDKVETKVMESLELSELSLAPGAETGVLTGTGKTAAGETFRLTVTQDPDTKKISWDAQGDRGTSETGAYSLE